MTSTYKSVDMESTLKQVFSEANRQLSKTHNGKYQLDGLQIYNSIESGIMFEVVLQTIDLCQYANIIGCGFDVWEAINDALDSLNDRMNDVFNADNQTDM